MLPSTSLKLFTRNSYFIKNVCKKYVVCCRFLHCISDRNLCVTSQNIKCKYSAFVTSNRSNYLRCFSSNVASDLIKESEKEDLSPSDDPVTYEVDFEAITQGDPDKLKKLKVLILELEVFRQEAMYVPKKITTDQWIELLQLRSRSQKLKQLKFWSVVEFKRRNDKIRREKRRLERHEKLKKLTEETEPCHIRYGLGGNTMFQRITETTMNNLANNRLVIAMKFGQNLVIDCSYDEYMTKREQSLCGKQLMLLFALNRSNDEPFNIHYCGVNHNGHMMKHLHKFIPTMYDDDFPINFHEKSYLDIFPKENLVYLTPHCRNELKTFSHDDIYIVGGIVDKTNKEPLSLAKAKSEGLRMAKFPLDRYLSWSIGGKSLTLDQCVAILLDMKETGNWDMALKHVPRRKLVHELDAEELEKAEDEKDKVPHYGQSFVTSHEWGLNKRRPSKDYVRARDLDLRSWLAARKKVR